jgi:hypothetical protein
MSNDEVKARTKSVWGFMFGVLVGVQALAWDLEVIY